MSKKAKRTVKVATKAKRPSKAKAIDAPEPEAKLVAAVLPSEAIEGFVARVKDWQRSSVVTVASGAVVMIVTAFAKDGRSRATYDETVEALKKRTAERGLKTAQVYKLVGLARALVKKMAGELGVGGPIRDVIACPTLDEAIDVVEAYYRDHKIKTLDDLGDHVGVYRRSEMPVPEARAPAAAPPPAAAPAAAAGTAGTAAAASPKGGGGTTAVPSTNGGGVPHLPGTGPGIVPDGVGADVAALGTIMPDQIVATAIAAGHTAIALGTALVPQLQTVAEIGMMIRLLTDRADHLNRPAAEPVPLEARRRQKAASAQKVASARGRQRQRMAA